jgi:hypothetical protein
MALTPAHRAALDSLSREDIRRQLGYAGPGMGSVVPGIGDGMALRAVVLEYLVERDEKEERPLRRRQKWAIGIAAISLFVSIMSLAVAVVALLSR